MHIAWFGKAMPDSGNITYSRETTNRLCNIGLKVSFLKLIISNDLEPFDNSDYKADIHIVPLDADVELITKMLRELKPDIVHISLAASRLDFDLPRICKKLGIPMIGIFHQPFNYQIAQENYICYQIYASTLCEYDYIIAISESQKQLLQQIGVDNAKINVIPYGIDTDFYCPPVSKNNESLIFLYQGRIAKEKNLEALLEAWIDCDMPLTSELLLMGTGDLLEDLSAKYKANNIKWLGHIKDKKHQLEILQNTDFFISPSLADAMSLSLLEAMSCGIYCIATDVGAHRELLEGFGTLLSPMTAKQELCSLLPTLDKNKTSKTREIYTISDSVEKLLQLYKRCNINCSSP